MCTFGKQFRKRANEAKNFTTARPNECVFTKIKFHCAHNLLQTIPFVCHEPRTWCASCCCRCTGAVPCVMLFEFYWVVFKWTLCSVNTLLRNRPVYLFHFCVCEAFLFAAICSAVCNLLQRGFILKCILIIRGAIHQCSTYDYEQHVGVFMHNFRFYFGPLTDFLCAQAYNRLTLGHSSSLSSSYGLSITNAVCSFDGAVLRCIWPTHSITFSRILTTLS